MNRRAFVGDYQRAFELTHVLGVDTEVGLHRHLDVNPLGDVDERASRPHGGVERAELVVLVGDDAAEVFLHDVLMLAEATIHVEEDDALLLEVLADTVVDGLRLVLCCHSREPLLLGLRYAQFVEGVPDVLGNVIPVILRAFARA